MWLADQTDTWMAPRRGIAVRRGLSIVVQPYGTAQCSLTATCVVHSESTVVDRSSETTAVCQLQYTDASARRRVPVTCYSAVCQVRVPLCLRTRMHLTSHTHKHSASLCEHLRASGVLTVTHTLMPPIVSVSACVRVCEYITEKRAYRRNKEF